MVTGFDPAAAAASDPGVLLAALGRPVTPPRSSASRPGVSLHRCRPTWRRGARTAPSISMRCLDFSRGAIASAKDMLLIEGIGGVMVPLDDQHTVLDWMVALNIPVVLVAGSYLGSLSHTLTSLDALRRRHLVIKALVINETPGSTVPTGGHGDDAQTLCRSRPRSWRCRAPRPRPIRRSRKSPRYFEASTSRSVASITRVAAFKSDSLMCSLALCAFASRIERGPAP